MKALFFIHILALGLALSSCVQTPVAPPSAVSEKPPSLPAGSVVDVPAVSKKLLDLVASDPCSKAAHGDQGTPPPGFMRGIAKSYVRAVCDPTRAEVVAASQAIGDPKKDALAWYGVAAETAADRLNKVYALMIGSAARESSWRWCVGKDPGATNTSAETCEAGLYQTSYNSRSASPVLKDLFAKYQEYPQGCFEIDYKGKTTCSDGNLKNWGTGEGVVFQQLSKQCPGFATEYHAVMLRVNRTHYGPINTKKDELKPVCVSMFEKIRALVVQDPGTCYAL